MPGTIFGFPGEVFLLLFSAFFYLVSIFFFLGPLLKEKTELMISLFAFLVGMAFFHIFMGVGFYFDSMLLIHLGAFAALTGSAFTLKFPLTVLDESKRKSIFYIVLAVAWLIVAYLLIFPHEMNVMLWLVFGYMIIVSGGITGVYIIWQGFKVKETWVKVKCIGGGSGLFLCCFIADIIVLLFGVSLVSEIFMMLAPVILILSLYIGRYIKKVSESQKRPQLS